ncbi:MAG TPA: hypothetical protein VEB22_06140 [Phycisphaerales bacterium]|nr:hypothetical protein [Phycisphaerales bacterium]
MSERDFLDYDDLYKSKVKLPPIKWGDREFDVWYRPGVITGEFEDVLTAMRQLPGGPTRSMHFLFEQCLVEWTLTGDLAGDPEITAVVPDEQDGRVLSDEEKFKLLEARGRRAVEMATPRPMVLGEPHQVLPIERRTFIRLPIKLQRAIYNAIYGDVVVGEV